MPRAAGGRIHGGERVDQGVPAGGFYVRPAIVPIEARRAIVRQETFAPILYVMKYRTLAEAIAIVNDVPRVWHRPIFTVRCPRSRTFLFGGGSRLRHRQREYRHQRCRNRWRLWRRKGNGRRPRIGLRLVEGLHAPGDQHGQLFHQLPLAQGIRFDV